jgi:hypothetical protein
LGHRALSALESKRGVNRRSNHIVYHNRGSFPHSIGLAEVLRGVEEPPAHQHQALVEALRGLAARQVVLGVVVQVELKAQT